MSVFTCLSLAVLSQKLGHVNSAMLVELMMEKKGVVQDLQDRETMYTNELIQR